VQGSAGTHGAWRIAQAQAYKKRPTFSYRDCSAGLQRRRHSPHVMLDMLIAKRKESWKERQKKWALKVEYYS
jgi:hypothetical protein